MHRIALVVCGVLAAAPSAWARPSKTPPINPSMITCAMVRSYVARVGIGHARKMALAAGMTAAEERRARQCLVGKAPVETVDFTPPIGPVN